MLYIDLIFNFVLFFILIKSILLFFLEKGIGIKLTIFTFSINILITIIILNNKFANLHDIKNIITNIILIALLTVLTFIHKRKNKNE